MFLVFLHLSFLQLIFWLWSKFFLIRGKPKHSMLLMIQLSQQVLWNSYLFVFADMNWLICITYFYWKSSCTILLIQCLETMSSLIDFDNFLHLLYKFLVLMLLGPLASILCLASAVESLSVASRFVNLYLSSFIWKELIRMWEKS